MKLTLTLQRFVNTYYTGFRANLTNRLVWYLAPTEGRTLFPHTVFFFWLHKERLIQTLYFFPHSVYIRVHNIKVHHPRCVEVCKERRISVRHNTTLCKCLLYYYNTDNTVSIITNKLTIANSSVVTHWYHSLFAYIYHIILKLTAFSEPAFTKWSF